MTTRTLHIDLDMPGAVAVIPHVRLSGTVLDTPDEYRDVLVDGETTTTVAVGWVYAVVEQVDGGQLRYVLMPDGVGTIEYAALAPLDPDSLTPLPANTTAWEVETERAAGAENALDARLDAQEAESATFGEIVSHDAAEFTTDGELATEVAARGSADTVEANTRASADTANAAAIAAEAIARGAAIAAEAAARAAAIIATTAPGVVAGYAESTSTQTTTATAVGSFFLQHLWLTIVGEGRFVDVKFYAPSVRHSVANERVVVVVNCYAPGYIAGKSQLGSARSSSTSNGVALVVERSVMLDAGVSYTFAVSAAGGSAGTCTFASGGTSEAMYLSVKNA